MAVVYLALEMTGEEDHVIAVADSPEAAIEACETDARQELIFEAAPYIDGTLIARVGAYGYTIRPTQLLTARERDQGSEEV